MTKKYELTDEHRAQLKPWADKWIANALRCGPYSDKELADLPGIMAGLYGAADLAAPINVVVCPDPVCAAAAWAYAAGVWYLREHPEVHEPLFGGRLSDAEIDAAAHAATWAGARSATAQATRVATMDATHQATSGATFATTAATIDATFAATRDATQSATHDDVRSKEVSRFLKGCLANWYRGRDGGNQWSGWSSYLSFFRHVAKLDIDYSKWAFYESAATYGPRFMHEKFVIVSALPEFIHQDAENRPHCETGPFCQWSTGRALYYWHGTEVPKEWIESPETIDPATALTWENVEQRRCAAEIIGWDRVLNQLPNRTIDEDKDPEIGTLIEVDLPDAGAERFLRVRCGTGRTFALPVPLEMTTALEAQAWTYGVDEIEIKKSEVRT